MDITQEQEFEFRLRLEQEQSQEKPFTSQLPEIASQAVQAASPVDLTKKFFQTDPATMQKIGGPALPIMGGLAGTPLGLAAPGAAVGELLRQVSGTALAPETVPKTALGRFGATAAAGVAQDPKILGAIPGVAKVGEVVGETLSKAGSSIGNGLAKMGQTLTGVKSGILKEAAKKGLRTYGAPSLEDAQTIFAKALGPRGQKAMTQSAKEAFDPAVEQARVVATKIGTKIEQGKPVTAFEALQARQATDRVISATPITDKIKREALYKWRNQFDNELSSMSGKLADASRTYRSAIVKDTLLNPTRLNKSGEPSAFLPMLVGHGMMGKGIGGGIGMLTGTSPAVWGLGATAGGSAAKGLNVLGQNPSVRVALMGILQKLMQGKQNGK